MPFGWPDLLRSIVDGKYFLKQFLGEEGDTGVFLADAPDNTAVEVRLTPEGSGNQAEWQRLVGLATELDHPNLLRYVAQGEARIDGNPYAFLVSEQVQERLGDVVEGRTLTPDEARYVVESAMNAIDHLHRRGFMHANLVPASIVAAGDSVKLLLGSVRPMPTDELESRRAVTADLREFAATVTELLTGKRELGAGAQLPSPFREFVRSSFGTEECPSPTAAQLIGVLNGQPLSAPKRVVEEAPAAPVPVLVPPPPPPVVQEPVRFKPGMATVIIAGVLVLALAIAGYRSITGRAASGEAPVRTRTSDIPAPVEQPRPSPVAPPQPVAPRAERWAVVAAAYNNYDAAARRAAQLSGQWKDGPLTVFPERGRGQTYLVIVASGLSQKEAERVRTRARRVGLPRDSYVTRLSR